MIVRTRIFELSNGKYPNLSELARAMGISVSQIYRVREGTRSINQGFIVGAIRAFPQYRLDELFYLAPDGGESAKKQLWRTQSQHQRGLLRLGTGISVASKASMSESCSRH